MDKAVTLTNIKSYRRNFNNNPTSKISMNAATRTDVRKVAMNWEAFRDIDHTFSDKVSGEMKATSQMRSGRCWGFAGLNLLRVYLGRKYKLKNFEFSQNYFIFFDKLEKANYFLENIIETVEQPIDSRLVMHLLSSPVQDGGQWDMFANLLKKYGAVPKKVMAESHQSSNTAQMNKLVTRKLREFALQLREASSKGKSPLELRTMKDDMMSIIYQMLCISLGTPPEKFDWSIRNKKDKFQRFTDLTPQKFYKEHVGINLDDFVCLINDPRSFTEYNKTYTVEYLGNVYGGNRIRYLNLETDELRKYTIKSIKADDPVWFGCDVGKFFTRQFGVMDMNLFEFDRFYGTTFSMNKAQRLEYGDSVMTHAMLFTGVDLKDKKPTKWRVENSWGADHGEKGFDIMTDSWFDQFMYEVVVHKKHLPKKVITQYNAEPIELPPWDPMGSLAH
ncbi:MAG TPA: aminopeptidase [Marine Group III euryarchaeote]|jgi:bleomycin hydrolase|uniref:Aminopeptidase n=1 Tax=Marine Group III euryarchaeote TaxID=2173149 RepID=A0A7J4GSZ6_9ARCH|nr:aminopeptidase [Marine Group III euryarchaeote]